MSVVASHITGNPSVCHLTGTRQRIHQSSASLAFVRGSHRWPVDSLHKGPLTRKMFPFDDVTMNMKGQMNALYTSGNNLFIFIVLGIEKYFQECWSELLKMCLRPFWHHLECKTHGIDDFTNNTLGMHSSALLKHCKYNHSKCTLFSEGR